ncbi:MAG: hypothetical protein AAF266_16865 [Planctomycetota bacterium]
MLFDWFKQRPAIHEEVDYRLAYQHMLSYEPKDGVDYGWVISYADRHLDRWLAVHRDLDDRAESIIRVFASGCALLSLGAIANASKFDQASLAVWWLGLLLAFSAVVAAGSVRYTGTVVLPTSIAWAAQIAESSEVSSVILDGQPPIQTAETEAPKDTPTAEAAFLSQMHLACEALRITATHKLRLIHRSKQLGTASLLAFVMAFPTGAFLSQVTRQTQAGTESGTSAPARTESMASPTGRERALEEQLKLPATERPGREQANVPEIDSTLADQDVNGRQPPSTDTAD